ncbi:hypothetical protein AO263_20480, partial [Pseudomonas sp. NZIPFR-PS5]
MNMLAGRSPDWRFTALLGLPGVTQWQTGNRAQRLQLRGQFRFSAKARAWGFPINSEWKPAAGILNDSAG